MVREFHEAFGLVVRDTPTLPDQDERDLRATLIREEYEEVDEALGLDFPKGIVYTAAELADLIYVVYGTALHYGIDLDAVVAEIHRANMAKRWPNGTVRRREDGKILKPDGWRPADVAGVLGP